MIPQKEIDVLDQHGGFTAITTKNQDTLWRPGYILKGNTIGVLQSYNKNSFYQLNDNATIAIYKVKGYRYPVVLWFDNTTCKRIA